MKTTPIPTQRREDAKAQGVPESIARIPVQAMVKADLQKLLSLAQRMLDGCLPLKQSTPEVGGVEEYALHLWRRVYAELERRKLLAAERADKGRVLWEIFSPRNNKPLSLSIFDQQRHVVRTPNRRIVHGEFWTIKPEWRVVDNDPWQEFAQEQKPLDLLAFQQYARDVDECVRRHRARQEVKL